MHSFSLDGVDYNEPTTNYVLDVDATSACVDVLIINDNQFEFSETFSGQILRVGALMDTVPVTEDDGLTVDVRNTEVTITDNDGETQSGEETLPMKIS